MASYSKCPKQCCNGTSFEVVPANILNSNIQHYFVQCSSCGCVINATLDPKDLAGIIAETVEKRMVKFFQHNR